jgi:peptidoglycan-associated lipoprotein
MRSISLAALAAAVAFSVSACASNPPPEPEPTPQPTETAVVTPPRVSPPPAPPTPPQPSGPVAGSRADFAAKATDRVYFDYDQHNLDDADRNALTSQISWLKQYPRTRVEIQGHADERGTQDYNIALGARRAEAVSSYLKAQGIAADRIQTISFGKDKPLDTGHDEAAWARNRNAYTNIIVEAIS